MRTSKCRSRSSSAVKPQSRRISSNILPDSSQFSCVGDRRMIPGEGHPSHPISAGVTTPRHNSAMTTEGSRIRPSKVLDPSPMAGCAQRIHQNRRIEDKEVTHRGRRIRASPHSSSSRPGRASVGQAHESRHGRPRCGTLRREPGTGFLSHSADIEYRTES